MKLILLLITSLLIACAGIPDGIKPVEQFEVNRYTGLWYEIARLDNWFERDLEKITAEYNLSQDGGVHVTNSGFNAKEGKREYAYGKAYFIDKADVGSLKVSFFGPFYGGYHIIDLDKENYSYVMITGNDKDYFWILAREPKLDNTILNTLVNKAKNLGFATEKLIYPKQQAANPLR
jgi:apolipoprotein D and lipocalin family protein